MITDYAYSGADDLAGMQAALAGWIYQAGACGYDHVGDVPHRLFNSFRGKYRLEEMVRLWYDGQALVAFALCFPHLKRYDAFVAPSYRGRQLERDVLDWANANTRHFMNQNGWQTEQLLTDVYACDTIRAQLLYKMGYWQDDASLLVINERSLLAELPHVVLPDGFSIRSAKSPQDAEALAAVHNGAFGSGWTGEIYLEEVMLKPGYRPELERVVVAPDGRFAAFCVLWLDEMNKIGLFEPVGTHPDFQRRGLGRALMADSLHLLRHYGMQTAYVSNEMENEASTALYRAMGFAPKHKIITYWHRAELPTDFA